MNIGASSAEFSGSPLLKDVHIRKGAQSANRSYKEYRSGFYEVFAKDGNTAFLFFQQARQQAECGCFAGPIRTEKTKDGSRGNLQVDPVQYGLPFGKPVAEVLRFDTIHRYDLPNETTGIQEACRICSAKQRRFSAKPVK